VSNRNRSFPSGRVTLYEAGSKVVSSASNNGNPLSETTPFRSPTPNKVLIVLKIVVGRLLHFTKSQSHVEKVQDLEHKVHVW
jgi:hypothetical protein